MSTESDPIRTAAADRGGDAAAALDLLLTDASWA